MLDDLTSITTRKEPSKTLWFAHQYTCVWFLLRMMLAWYVPSLVWLLIPCHAPSDLWETSSWAPVGESLRRRHCAAHRQVVTMVALLPAPKLDGDQHRSHGATRPLARPSLPPGPRAGRCASTPGQTKLTTQGCCCYLSSSWWVYHMEVNPSSRVLFLVLISPITRANQAFTNLLVRSELYFGVVYHILMQHGYRFID
jgi:hypothetical protein